MKKLNKNFSFLQKAHSGSGFSNLDPDAIDLVKYPDIAKIRWTYTTLYPGDCLYIPSSNHISVLNVAFLHDTPSNMYLQNVASHNYKFLRKKLFLNSFFCVI